MSINEINLGTDSNQNNSWLFKPVSNSLDKTVHFDNHSVNLTPSQNESLESNLFNQSWGWVGQQNTEHDNKLEGNCSCSQCCSAAMDTTFLSSDSSFESSSSSTLPFDVNTLLKGYSWGFSWGNRTISYSFYNSSDYYGNTSVKPVSEGIKTNVRQIFTNIATLIDVNFVEVNESSGQIGRIRFLLDPSVSYASAYYPSSDSEYSKTGDVRLNPNYDRLGDTNGFQHSAGKHGYRSLVHEIGHTLGLKHPHDFPSLPSAQDNTTNTIMSYNKVGSSSGTFMPYDIAALQYLYGAKDYNGGNNTYWFNAVDEYAVDGQVFLSSPNATKISLWDSGGIDTVDFSTLAFNSGGYRFDLNPGGSVRTQNSDKTLTAIAYNVFLENVILSNSNDEIFLNEAANTIRGYQLSANGNDIIWNSNNFDTLDLSLYATTSVSKTQNGQDLILGLGSNGSITVKDYYGLALNDRLNILYSTDTVINNSPVATNDSYTLNEDTKLTIDALNGVLNNDSDADGDNLSVSLMTNTSKGNLTLNSNGSFTYQPDDNVNGTDSFTYEVSDNKGGTSQATVTLTIKAVNDAPVATNDGYSLNENTSLTANVLDNDRDVDQDNLTTTVVTGVSNGDLTLNSDGSFTYIPNGDFKGTDSFTYQVSDGILTDTATVGLTVQDPNRTNHIGEFGQISHLDSNWQTITLQNNYLNPVVFIFASSYNDSDPGVVRVTDVQNNQFSAFFQEPTYLDGVHTQETVSYMVLEAGTWVLENGTKLEVGSTSINQLNSGVNVSYSDAFSNAPVIFSQVQTYNDTAPQDTFTNSNGQQEVDIVYTRQANVTTQGFQLILQEEEARMSSGRTTDTVGWLAIEQGSGTWNGNTYQVGVTPDTVTHRLYSLDFQENLFNEKPHFFANVTFDGRDSSGMRAQNLTSQGVQVFVEEEQSKGTEVNHTKETVSFLAIAGNRILTGEQSLSNDSLTGEQSLSNSHMGINNSLVDELFGTQGKDRFILRTETDIYYDDYGAEDYGVIENFKRGQDTIELHGSSSDYKTQRVSDLGLGIFYGANEELIGIIENHSNIMMNHKAFV